MVYCTSCGKKNPDDAKNCSKCGEPLTSSRYGDDDCFGFDRRIESIDERGNCFGIPNIIWPLFFGALIVIWGLSILLEWPVGFIWSNLWPYFVILIGIVIIVSALYRRR